MPIIIPDEQAEIILRHAEAAGYADATKFILEVLAQRTPPMAAPGADVGGVETPSFFEAAAACGQIGGGGEYPADLSSKPEHFNGFGR